MCYERQSTVTFVILVVRSKNTRSDIHTQNGAEPVTRSIYHGFFSGLVTFKVQGDS